MQLVGVARGALLNLKLWSEMVRVCVNISWIVTLNDWPQCFRVKAGGFFRLAVLQYHHADGTAVSN